MGTAKTREDHGRPYIMYRSRDKAKNYRENSWLLELPNKKYATLSSSELPIAQSVQWEVAMWNRRFLQQLEQHEWFLRPTPTL